MPDTDNESSALLRLVTRTIAIDEESSIEQCAAAKTKLQAMSGIVREAVRLLDERIIACMQAHEVKSFEVGDIRYYTAVPKETKCVDVPGTVNAVLEQFSMDDLIAILVSQPFKPGAAKKLLGDTTLFETTEKLTLKEGKPERTPALMSVNTKFVEAHDD